MKTRSLYHVTEESSEEVWRGIPARLPLRIVTGVHLTQAEQDMLREDGEPHYEIVDEDDPKVLWRKLRQGADVDVAHSEGVEGGYSVLEWRESDE